MTRTVHKYVRLHPHFIGVLVDWKTEDSKDYAIKLIAHRGFDRLLCDHVYFRFCPECPQFECDRISI